MPYEEKAPSVSPLDEDLGSVDTSMPLIKPGIYDLEIVQVEEKPNKAGTGTNLSIQLKTTRDAQDTNGNALSAGFPIFTNISQTPTERYDLGSIRRANAKFLEAMEGKATRMNPLERFVGKVVRCKVVIQKATDQYDAGNQVKSFMSIGATKE